MLKFWQLGVWDRYTAEQRFSFVVPRECAGIVYEIPHDLPYQQIVTLQYEQKANMLAGAMDEGRKRVIGIMAAIVAARKLCTLDRVRMVPASVSAIADAVRWAEEIMKEVDRVVGLKK
jgi:hypothetical protein